MTSTASFRNLGEENTVTVTAYFINIKYRFIFYFLEHFLKVEEKYSFSIV